MPTSPASPTDRLVAAYRAGARVADALQPLFLLGLRLYVAWIFFNSGLIKLGNWTGTLGLFANEFHVPLLPPGVAAVMGTATEVGVPVFLVLGLGGRLAAFVLFVFNAIAVVSYPDLSAAGLRDHAVWATMLAVITLFGPGTLSVDAWLGRRSGGLAPQSPGTAG